MILSLQGLRGLSVIMVMLHHGVQLFFPHLFSYGGTGSGVIDTVLLRPLFILFSGDFAVALFFTLSAYVLTLTTLRHSQRYYLLLVARYARLALPVLAASIITSLFVFMIDADIGEMIKRTGAKESFMLPEDHSIKAFFIDGALNVWLYGKSTLNPPLWTMQIELLGSFFVYTHICLYQSSRMPLRTMSIIMLVLLALISWNTYFICFVYGILLGHLHQRGGVASWQLPGVIAIVLAGLVLTLGTHNATALHGHIDNVLLKAGYSAPLYSSQPLFRGGLCMLLILIVTHSHILNRIFSGHFFVAAGDLSFALYLLHFPLLTSLGCWVYLSASDVVGGTASYIAIGCALLVSWVLALGFYRGIDKPAMALSRKIK